MPMYIDFALDHPTHRSGSVKESEHCILLNSTLPKQTVGERSINFEMLPSVVYDSTQDSNRSPANPFKNYLIFWWKRLGICFVIKRFFSFITTFCFPIMFVSTMDIDGSILLITIFFFVFIMLSLFSYLKSKIKPRQKFLLYIPKEMGGVGYEKENEIHICLILNKMIISTINKLQTIKIGYFHFIKT